MTPAEIKTVLELHGKYLRNEPDGKRAYLTYANLTDVNLTDVNLTGADLTRADLTDVNLTGADLTDANLRGANLAYADLRGANLTDANLTDANLAYAKTDSSTVWPRFQIPQTGTLRVWKSCVGRGTKVIVELEVPAKAKRTASLVGRKCRAEYVKVVKIHSKSRPVLSGYNGSTKYVVGKIVRPDSYDPDPKIECTHGIHFFLTREEAEEY